MRFDLTTNNPEISRKESISIPEWFKVNLTILFLVVLTGIFLPEHSPEFVFLKNLISFGGIIYIFKEIGYTRQNALEICRKHLLTIKKYFIISVKYLTLLSVLLLILALIFVLFLKLSGLENDFKFFINESVALRENPLDFMKTGFFLGKVRLLLYAFSISVLTPIAEEILDRRFLYVSLRKKLSFLSAAFLNSAVFGILHFPDLITGFFVGLFLCYVYEKEGNILINVIIHGTKNFLAVLLLIYIN